MDRNTIFALALIFIILLFWQGPYMRWLSPPQETPGTVEEHAEVAREIEGRQRTGAIKTPQKRASTQGPRFDSIETTNLPEKFIEIETPLYHGFISSKGGTIEEWVLKDYPGPLGEPVNLIRINDTGNLALSFLGADSSGYRMERTAFDFIPENLTFSGDTYKISVSDRPRSITMTADLGDNRYISKRFTFDPYSFTIEMVLEFRNCQRLISNQEYSLFWGTGIRTSETNTEEDMRFAKSMALYGSSIEKVDIGDGNKTEGPFNGDIHWIATKSKYFCSLIIPKENPGISVQLSGQNIPEEKDIGRKNYVTALTMSFIPSEPVYTNRFLVYLGPVDSKIFDAISQEFDKDLRLEEILDINSFIRPLSMLIYSIFNFLHGLIPNYGIVIIIFSILINLVMFPLTAKSYKSMKKMQDLQPLLNELREKYKKEPQKLQKAQVKLYKEQKVNPLGSCLPMLLQMPIFFAIYPIFRSIELRGAPFIWWIKDLSQPDTVATLSFSIPMYGNQLNILTIIYAISLFIQQKIMMKDPKQKMMVYIMPVMLLLFLNRLSSGFILYFIIFNLLSITQRYLVRDKGGSEPKPAPPPVPAKLQNKNPSKKGKKRAKKK